MYGSIHIKVLNRENNNDKVICSWLGLREMGGGEGDREVILIDRFSFWGDTNVLKSTMVIIAYNCELKTIEL